MKYLGKMDDPKDLVTKEYVDSKAGGGVVVVNVNEDSPMTADKTFAEMKAIVESGKTLVAKFQGVFYTLIVCTENSIIFSMAGATNTEIEASQLTCFSEDDSWSHKFGQAVFNWGSSRANEFLVVNNNGDVTTRALSTWTGGNY